MNVPAGTRGAGPYTVGTPRPAPCSAAWRVVLAPAVRAKDDDPLTYQARAMNGWN